MDTILELAENFAIERKTTKVRPKRKSIPSNNPEAFCNIVRPILEGQKIHREEVCSLPCHASHEIKPRSTRVKENDNLYAIFASETQQTPYFLQKWLRTFMQSHKTYFKKCGQFYLSTKGLDLDTWMEAIDEGRKGDVLTLYGLSLLMDVHTYIHLHNGQFWSTLKNVPSSHDETLRKYMPFT